MGSSASYHAVLNRLVIELDCSLLQYVGESSPWMEEGDMERQTMILRLVEQESAVVRQVIDFLASRRWPVEYGTYPTDYTDLQYLSLDFLLTQLVDHAEKNCARIASCQEQMTVDAEITALLNTLLTVQQSISDALRRLASPEKNVSEQNDEKSAV